MFNINIYEKNYQAIMKLDSIYTIVLTIAINSVVKVAAVTALKLSLCKLNET